ncbi:5-oxoprolinase [Aspergillus sclerotioniger CBS 115572]|uniref:5-oxoprolinase n=1 Tax=Aspergillus sclerotioniger CBS 115572 TaxID=1450535 RepID=A0A317X3H1_9EURO|nr:5-oxoprolinase [Aspergillus sclerotioniger CBS 115572]PWY93106.1 5-oxoprolinase [Aspergillus sclerotioniger CBS 115572]
MPSVAPRQKLRISIDRGGTFTDCICKVPGKEDIIVKILSIDPKNYDDAPTEAIRRVLEVYCGTSIPRGTGLDTKDIESIRMGTTVATNALLERKGERTALLITAGFRDLLEIGNQSRPFMFDLSIRRPETLYSDVFEVDERVALRNCTDTDLRSLDLSSPLVEREVAGTSGETVQIIRSLDLESTERYLRKIYADGFRSIAVCLMHAYTFPDHEVQIRDLAQQIGFENVSLSHVVSQRTKIVPRGNSAVIDGYLTPTIERYLRQFLTSFPDIHNSDTMLEFMQSDGGLVPANRLSGLHSILSGPAGGVVGYARTCYDEVNKAPLIGFDMGGTSTDVSRYDGALDHIFETTTAGISMQTPQLNINTIAAGGGSILFWRDGLMSVGPESASSDPGPACYRKGGPLTVTDANLALGRLIPEYFPSVFGPNEDEPLDRDIVISKFEALTATMNQDTGKSMTWAKVAQGFLDVANSAMCGPIRSLTEARGYDTTKHHLASFGGAGGQHACAIAELLGIKKVLIHKHSSILSAYGIGLADVVQEGQRPCAKAYDSVNIQTILTDLEDLSDSTKDMLGNDGILNVDVECFLNMRYDGSETTIMIAVDPSQNMLQLFVDAHHQQFGFTPTNRQVFVDSIRVRVVGRRSFESPSPDVPIPVAAKQILADSAAPRSTNSVYFDQIGWTNTPVYILNSIPSGQKVQGPALVVDKTQTILVGPESSATSELDKLIIDVSNEKGRIVSVDTIDLVQLSVFRYRFMSVVEQMGRVLQQVSVSANIKERLDFSCAVFSPDGSLVANAPHVPAMIGSMAFAVRGQIGVWKGKLKAGDVLLSNAPEFGGTHLPDLTVITPVFDARGEDIIFWTASRGHHADIGGILPGSMPPTSKHLNEEGALFESFLLIRDGILDEIGLSQLLCEEPAKHPGSSGTRRYQDNLTDLKAQVAANHCGIRLIHQLIQEYSMDVVQVYMKAIQSSAELAIRNLFKRLARDFHHTELIGTDYMDDGTPIHLKVTLNENDGSAVFDFTGTGPQVYGNWNAPIAITHSAIIFSLRCMVDSDIPLNHGCLAPVTVHIPKPSLLNPAPTSAVCAGNVLTSQRIVDVIFKTLRVCAASQGCMNNFSFGTDDFGYYETIAGGSGAGPTWSGTNGVHTNMTNTRITDPESLERRYPVLLRRFCFRAGSGGCGRYKGGDGVIRDVEFRIPMMASILSERRAFRPYGMNGGGDGVSGLNLWIKGESGTRVSIGGKNSVAVSEGDRLVIETPGGGGYGRVEDRDTRVGDGAKESRGFIPIANGSVEATRSLAEQV